MKCISLRTAAALLAAAVLFSASAAASPAVSAQCAILTDAMTGRVLYEKNADSKQLIASTTKIMTAIVVLEACDINETVTVMPEAVGIEGSSMYLESGEILTVRELLLGMMLHSGNDAATALALHCDGAMESFVERMNLTAERLGMAQSHFANPHGLDHEQNYSTARDLARLSAYAMENTTFCEIVSAKSAVAGGRTLTNHNKLLWRVEGAIGVKTGYTRSAGRILVGAAERNGRRLISVTINAPNDWSDHESLFEFGFSSYALRSILAEGEKVSSVSVLGGDRDFADIVSSKSFSYVLSEGETPELVLHLPRFRFAPIERGTMAGSADVVLNGVILETVPLVWADSVYEPTEDRGLLGKVFGGLYD